MSSGYKLYMPESVERFKNMFVKVVKGKLYAVHLHREVAWHGIKAMDKQSLFRRKRVVKDNIVLSIEDSILIHVAHVVFENFKIKNKELLLDYLNQKVDWKYINKVVSINGWKKEFNYVLNNSHRKLDKKRFLRLLIRKALSSIDSWPYFFGKLIGWRRNGCLIAVVGVNGAGKSTISKSLLEKYKPITDFFSGQAGYYYGWDPYLTLTKIISKRNKVQGKSVYKKMKEVKFSLSKEAMIVYSYIEYMARYYMQVKPMLRKGKLVVCDRYFYDLYGQNKYKGKVTKMLMKLFPKPDYLFLLDAEMKNLISRDKFTDIMSSNVKRSSVRKVHTPEEIMGQKKRYYQISKMFKGELVNTDQNINKNVDMIIERTWGKLV